MLPDRDEFWVPVPNEERAEGAAPLAAVFVLQPSVTLSGSVEVHRLFGGLAVSHLMANTQGLWAAYTEVDAARMFSLYAGVARSVPIFALEYPRCVELLPELVRTIGRVTRASAAGQIPGIGLAARKSAGRAFPFLRRLRAAFGWA